MKTEIRFDRLEKLADHLIDGKLGHEHFDLLCFNEGITNKKGCGSNGCAIGECPIVFPEEWFFAKNSRKPLLIKSKRIFNRTFHSSLEFFNINPNQFRHLFIASCQEIQTMGGKILDGDATAKEVGQNILTFIEKMKSNN